MADDARVCKECGVELTADSPQGLCPQCFLTQALESQVAGSLAPAAAKTVIDPTPKSERPPDWPPSIANRKSEIPNRKVRYFGDYELLEEIARGGMGVVYKARQVSLNRVVAVKMVLAGQLAGEAEVKRFRIEAEAAANLQHPNIVAIHEIGLHEGQHYFSMDYVDGVNLSAVMQGKPLAVRRAAKLAQAMAEAIQYAHQRGIMHRDLKPQNVVLDEQDQPHITDFGLAKQIAGESGLTRTGAVMGTPSYMSPEQATGRQDLIGPHSDVYALGAILYEMLTGRAPFKAETPVATLRQVLETPPTRPTNLDEAVPPDLETICLKCLEKEPHRRYATVRALAEDLGRFLRQEPVLAQPMGAARRAGYWLQTHPWSLTGVATILVMGLLSLAFWLWEENRYLQYAASHPEYRQTAASRRYHLPLADGIRAWLFNTGQPGARTALAEGIFVGATIAFFGWFPLMIRYRMKSRRLTWRQLQDIRINRSAACGPVSRRLRNACLLIGAVLCGFGLLLLFATIHAIVWEGAAENVAMFMFFTLALCWIGARTFWSVTREQSAVAHGLPVEVAATTHNPPANMTFTRLAMALLPGVVVGGMLLWFSQTELKPVLLPGVLGWLWGISAGFVASFSRHSARFGILLLGTVLFGPATLRALGVDPYSSFIYWGGVLAGGLPTSLAFQGIVFDRVNPAKPGVDSSRPS